MSIAIEKTLVEAIDHWSAFHREELIADLIQLVRIPSVSQKNAQVKPYGEPCRQVLETMLAIGKKYGFQTANYDYHCGALWLEDWPKAKTVGLWGHLDVVPEGSGWTHTQPYEPVLQNGYLIGRGSQDNKGPALADLYLIRCMAELGVLPSFNLRLYVGCDEENGMEDLSYFTENHTCPDLSIITDSGFPVCYGEKGMLGIDLVSLEPLSAVIETVEGGLASNIVPDQAGAMLALPGGQQVYSFDGVSKHAAFPEGGHNAIGELCREFSDLAVLSPTDRALFAALAESHRDFYGTGLGIACQDSLSGQLTCVGSMIRLEGRQLLQHYNVRYPITTDSTQLIKTVTDWAATHGFRLEVARDSKPNHFPREHPAVSILTDCYNTLEGQDSQPFVMGGGTYARKLPNAFAFGMGLSLEHAPKLFEPGHGDCHGPDEAQYIDNLLRAIKIMIIGLVQLDRAGAVT